MDAIKRLIDPLKRKVLLGIARAIVKAVDDDKQIQRMQVALFADEVRDSVERFQEYGFTSNPFPEAEAVAIFPGGNRSHGLIIAVDDRRYRLKGLKNGEVALYSDEGDYIKFKRGNVIEIHTPKATFSGDVEIAGKLDVTKDITSQAQINDLNGSMSEIRSVYNDHEHGGVESGGSETETPGSKMT
jgi:phage baseplate assembly protein V